MNKMNEYISIYIYLLYFNFFVAQICVSTPSILAFIFIVFLVLLNLYIFLDLYCFIHNLHL